MKNRLYGLLMLIIPFLVLGGIYYYFQILNKGSIYITSNVENYEVSLYSKALKISFKTHCENKTCELIDLAPVGYTLSVSKDGYNNITKTIELGNKEEKNINIELEKTKSLEEVSFDFEKQDLFGKYYKYFYLDDVLYYFIQENEAKNVLTLYRKENDKTTKLYTFVKKDKDNIFIDKVYGSNQYIYIKYENKDYIYDLKNFKINSFKNDYDINYVKYDKDKFIFILDLGVFYCDTDLKNVENIGIFNDFITSALYGFIFYVDKNDQENLEKYDLDGDNSYFLSYDATTKTSEIIYKTKKSIKKIYRYNNEIYIYDGEKYYKVKNLE